MGFEVDLTVSTNIGQVGAQSYVVNLETATGSFEVTMAVYEDSSYTKVAASDHSITVPDLVYVGVVGNNFGSSGYVIQTQECWVTPDSNPDNTIRYDVITNGCADSVLLHLNSSIRPRPLFTDIATSSFVIQVSIHVNLLVQAANDVMTSLEPPQPHSHLRSTPHTVTVSAVYLTAPVEHVFNHQISDNVTLTVLLYSLTSSQTIHTLVSTHEWLLESLHIRISVE